MDELTELSMFGKTTLEANAGYFRLWVGGFTGNGIHVVRLFEGETLEEVVSEAIAEVRKVKGV